MSATIDKKLLLFLFIAFILATVVGTVSHELGHYFVAKYLGYDVRISYASTNIRGTTIFASDSFWFTWGGPFVTMFAGTAGFILLFIFCQSYYSTDRLEFRHWALIFLSLFWLRQPAVFILWLFTGWLGKEPLRVDEIRIANNLQLPGWSILVLSAIIGAAVLIIVVFRFIPFAQRLTFILAGLLGGIAGYMLWMYLLGPVFLPV